jgi:hypothetical protein
VAEQEETAAAGTAADQAGAAVGAEAAGDCCGGLAGDAENEPVAAAVVV